MDGARKSILRLTDGGSSFAKGTLSEEDGVSLLGALVLLVFETFLGLTPSHVALLRPVGGLSWAFLLREQEPGASLGLEATFLRPAGLPGFLFFPPASSVVRGFSAVVTSPVVCTSLSTTGILASWFSPV